MAWWLLLATGWTVAIVWAVSTVRTVRFLHGSRLVDRAGATPDPPMWPRVSVVVPARDEAKRIEEALRSLVNLDYPAFEVIAVDDRSTDATGAIMDRFAAEEPRVRPLHIAALPEGWLGKCHAMQAGARLAGGELLLFTDGDVVFAPDTLRLAVRNLLERKLDHLALLPGLVPGGYWEDAVKSYFAMLFILGVKAWAAGSASKEIYVGIGAFNLLRRTAYETIGGHESLRLDVADDLMLGKRVKQAGFRQEALIASGHLSLRWQEGVGGFIRGLEKNGFAALGFSLPFLLLVTALVFLLYAVPYLGVLSFRDARVSGYALSVLLMHGIYGYFASIQRNGWLLAPVLPLAAFLYLFALWRSAVITLRQGGVRWRETFYPLDLLKRWLGRQSSL
ncbi:MAG: glycosyl transferase, family 2 [Deltaproteobacteria bacterium]|nr:glycosyl transferase, family 2 [Deltaproteobacteria bacterium]